MTDVIDHISERAKYFACVLIGAKTLEIVFISDYQAHGLLL